MDQKTTLALAGTLVLLAGGAGYWIGLTTSAGPAAISGTQESSTAVMTSPTQEHAELFDLGRKLPGTELYISKKHKIGFTYSPTNEWGHPIEVTEGGNKIYIHGADEAPDSGQSVEIFTKNPAHSLAQAITERFLTGLDPEDCFVKIYENRDTLYGRPGYTDGRPEYIAAGISYPRPSDPDTPAWAGAERCAWPYSETNGYQYFLMNPEAPDRFIFVSVGQYSITSDGTPRAPKGPYFDPDWDQSIRILK